MGTISILTLFCCNVGVFRQKKLQRMAVNLSKNASNGPGMVWHPVKHILGGIENGYHFCFDFIKL